MTEYRTMETTTPGAYRATEILKATTLSEAKKEAVRKQVFHGTILTIEADGEPVARRTGKTWKTL